MTWNGPDPDLRQGPGKTCAKGANGELLNGKVALARGPNPGKVLTVFGTKVQEIQMLGDLNSVPLNSHEI